MDGRPNRGNKATFTDSFGVVWTRPSFDASHFIRRMQRVKSTRAWQTHSDTGNLASLHCKGL